MFVQYNNNININATSCEHIVEITSQTKTTEKLKSQLIFNCMIYYHSLSVP